MPNVQFLTFVWDSLIMKYDYTITVRYRTPPVLIANTFLNNLSSHSAAYSVNVNSGTFIAEMII